MKRLIPLLIITVILYSGCASRCTWDGKLKFVNQEQEANLILDNIIEALENGDSQALKEIFASKVQEELGGKLEDQIEQAIEYFEGEAVSYDAVGTVSGGESMREGKLVYSGIDNARSENVVTTEDTYTISFSAVLVDDKEANQGVWRIWLGKNKEDYMILGISEMPLS